MSVGYFPESLSQDILVGIILVGRLGVLPSRLTVYAVQFLFVNLISLSISHVPYIYISRTKV